MDNRNLLLKLLTIIFTILLLLFIGLGAFFWLKGPLAIVPLGLGALAFFFLLTWLRNGKAKDTVDYEDQVGRKENFARYGLMLAILFSFLLIFHGVNLHLRWNIVARECSRKVEPIKATTQAYNKWLADKIENTKTESVRLAGNIEGNIDSRENYQILTELIGQKDALNSDAPKQLPFDRNDEDIRRRVEEMLPEIEETLTDAYTLDRDYMGFYRRSESIFNTPFNAIGSSMIYDQIDEQYDAMLSDIRSREQMADFEAIGNSHEIEVVFDQPFYSLRQASFEGRLTVMGFVLFVMIIILLEYFLTPRSVNMPGNYAPRHLKSYAQYWFIGISILGIAFILFI